MLEGFCIALPQIARMDDLSITHLIAEWLRQDPIRALGLVGFACIAISVTTNADLLALLGFVDVDDEGERDTSIA